MARFLCVAVAQHLRAGTYELEVNCDSRFFYGPRNGNTRASLSINRL
jgi:hypothetical protein